MHEKIRKSLIRKLIPDFRNWLYTKARQGKGLAEKTITYYLLNLDRLLKVLPDPFTIDDVNKVVADDWASQTSKNKQTHMASVWSNLQVFRLTLLLAKDTPPAIWGVSPKTVINRLPEYRIWMEAGGLLKHETVEEYLRIAHIVLGCVTNVTTENLKEALTGHPLRYRYATLGQSGLLTWWKNVTVTPDTARLPANIPTVTWDMPEDFSVPLAAIPAYREWLVKEQNFKSSSVRVWVSAAERMIHKGTPMNINTLVRATYINYYAWIGPSGFVPFWKQYNKPSEVTEPDPIPAKPKTPNKNKETPLKYCHLFPTEAQVAQSLSEYPDWVVRRGCTPNTAEVYRKALRQLLKTVTSWDQETVNKALSGMKQTPNYAWNGNYGFLAFWNERNALPISHHQIQSLTPAFRSWMREQGHTERVAGDYAKAVLGLSLKVKSFSPTDLAPVLNKSKHYRNAWRKFMIFYQAQDISVEAPTKATPVPEPEPVTDTPTDIRKPTKADVEALKGAFELWLSTSRKLSRKSTGNRMSGLRQIIKHSTSPTLDDIYSVLNIPMSNFYRDAWLGGSGFMHFWTEYRDIQTPLIVMTPPVETPEPAEALSKPLTWEGGLKTVAKSLDSNYDPKANAKEMVDSIIKEWSEDNDLLNVLMTQAGIETPQDSTMGKCFQLLLDAAEAPKPETTPQSDVYEQSFRTLIKTMFHGSALTDPTELTESFRDGWATDWARLNNWMDEAGINRADPLITLREAIRLLKADWDFKSVPQDNPYKDALVQIRKTLNITGVTDPHEVAESIRNTWMVLETLLTELLHKAGWSKGQTLTFPEGLRYLKRNWPDRGTPANLTQEILAARWRETKTGTDPKVLDALLAKLT